MTSNLLCTTASLSVLLAHSADGRAAIAYSPFGHHASGRPFPDFLAFNGERPEPVTGHYLLGNGYRAFNPTLMRFNSPDSWSPFGDGGLNAYAYCAGDPVNNIDPDGHWGSLAYVARFVGKLKSGRANRVARQVLGMDSAPVRADGSIPGPSVMPLSPRTRRRQIDQANYRRSYANPEKRAAKLKKNRDHRAKLRGEVQRFGADEARGIYATKISTKNFMLLPQGDRERALAKARVLYGFEKNPSLDRPFFTKDGLLDVHHFDLASASAMGGGSKVFARGRRMNYITKHISAVRTGE